jgi:hypothetical protein
MGSQSGILTMTMPVLYANEARASGAASTGMTIITITTAIAGASG